MKDILENKDGRNWIEDYSHENGKYVCKCVVCQNDFMGHKRRVVCKICDAQLALEKTQQQ